MNIVLELQFCCGNRSGIGTYTYEIARRLKDGDGLHFCGNLFNFLGKNDYHSSLEGINMPISVFRMFPYGVYRRAWQVIPFRYETLFETPGDLTVFFNYVVPPRISGKVITTVHDLTYLRYPETMDSRNLHRLKEGTKRSIEQSDRILTVSEFSKREIIELLGVNEEKISVVPNAASCTDELTDFEELRRKYTINGPYVLYVGTIEPRKNLNRLIKAFELLKSERKLPHQLVLAGGSGWKNDEIFEAARNSPFSDDIIFTGYISGAEKNTLYKNASVFSFPSLYEGFGIPPLEAMHWGCPVVTSNAASLPEVTGNAAELVDPMSAESIADGLWHVLSNPIYAETLIANGKVRAKEYTWEASAKRLTQICKEVLNN